VQLYNADALLRCSLPFHDTNVFVRVLQLLKISAGRWSWLLGLQVGSGPRAPCPRVCLDVYLRRCVPRKPACRSPEALWSLTATRT